MQLLDTLSRDDERPEILRLLGLTEFMHDAQDKIAYTEAIEDLHSVSIRIKYAAIDRDEYPIPFNRAARAPNRFYELLAAHNPVACMVTVHFIALFAQARPVWWVEKWPRWLLDHTEQLLAATPDLLEWLQ